MNNNAMKSALKGIGLSFPKPCNNDAIRRKELRDLDPVEERYD